MKSNMAVTRTATIHPSLFHKPSRATLDSQLPHLNADIKPVSKSIVILTIYTITSHPNHPNSVVIAVNTAVMPL